MKKMLILLVILVLPACYNISFDSLEYDRYITIKELADHAATNCADDIALFQISSLKQTMDHQYLYSSNRAGRPRVASATRSLKEIVDGLYESYQQGTPSVLFCQQKTANISSGADIIIKELGKQ